MLSPELRYAGLVRGLERTSRKAGHKAIAQLLERCRADLIDLETPKTIDPQNILGAVDCFLDHVFSSEEPTDVECETARKRIATQLEIVK